MRAFKIQPIPYDVFVEGKELATKRHCKFIEVSALLSHKTDDLLVGVIRQIRIRQARRRSGQQQSVDGDAFDGRPADKGGIVGCLQTVTRRMTFCRMFRRNSTDTSNCDDLFAP